MTGRKSLSPKEIKQKTKNKITKDLYIISQPKDPRVEDFLPSYNFTYEGVDVSDESEEIIESLRDFMKENQSLVIDKYNSKSMEALQEGFSRATAICELFIRSMYLEDITEE